MTIHIFRYSQLIDTDRMLTIKAFATATGLSEGDIAGIASKEEEKGGWISQYKSGGIDTIKFRTKLNELIQNKGGIQLADNAFDDCWNAICTVNKLYQFQLEHEGYKIHIIGDANELQHKYINISARIALLEKTPKITYTLSFEEHTLDREELREVAKSIYQDLDIVWHHKETGDSLELLAKHYNSSEESSLVEQDIIDEVFEDSTNESSKSHSLVEDTIDVMGGLELSSTNPDSVE